MLWIALIVGAIAVPTLVGQCWLLRDSQCFCKDEFKRTWIPELELVLLCYDSSVFPLCDSNDDFSTQLLRCCDPPFVCIVPPILPCASREVSFIVFPILFAIGVHHPPKEFVVIEGISTHLGYGWDIFPARRSNGHYSRSICTRTESPGVSSKSSPVLAGLEGGGRNCCWETVTTHMVYLLLH